MYHKTIACIFWLNLQKLNCNLWNVKHEISRIICINTRVVPEFSQKKIPSKILFGNHPTIQKRIISGSLKCVNLTMQGKLQIGDSNVQEYELNCTVEIIIHFSCSLNSLAEARISQSVQRRGQALGGPVVEQTQQFISLQFDSITCFLSFATLTYLQFSC